MILKFDEYVLNEGSNESVVPLKSVKKLLEPFGWNFKHSNGGDNMVISKGKYVTPGHLLHGHSKDDNRIVSISQLNRLRKMFISEFQETGDLSTIKAVPWDEWHLLNPLDKELANIDPETGKEKTIEPELNIGQKLLKAKIEKSIKDANEKYKDAQLMKISDTCCIMANVNEKGVLKYNTCRSESDRRPILHDWFDGRTNYKKLGSDHYFGKDNLRDMSTRFYRVLDDGTLDKHENIALRESKNIAKDLEML